MLCCVGGEGFTRVGSSCQSGIPFRIVEETSQTFALKGEAGLWGILSKRLRSRQRTLHGGLVCTWGQWNATDTSVIGDEKISRGCAAHRTHTLGVPAAQRGSPHNVAAHRKRSDKALSTPACL